MLIAIDGIDGAGKTTLASALFGLLEKYNPLLEKEPTAISPWGKMLRDSAIIGRLTREEELEYFHKDRLFHIEQIIKPALKIGRVVILDRYVDSTLAFQALDPQDADRLYERFIKEILVPDITFILDCPIEMALMRIERTRQAKSTFEKLETLERAQIIYRSRRSDKYIHIDSSRNHTETLNQAIQALMGRYPHLRLQSALDQISSHYAKQG